MPPLPVISGMEACNAFERAGWQFLRQKGSHMILIRSGVPVALSIPQHDVLDRGLLCALMRNAGLSVEEFIELLK